MQQYKYDTLNEVLYYKRLTNGLDVYFLPKKGYNKKYAIFSTKYGSIDNTFVPINEDKYITVPKGIAHFLEHKLFEKEQGDLSNEFTKLGADVNAYTTYNRTAYLFSTTQHFYENLSLLLDMVQTPYFTETLIKKEQGIISQEISMYDDYPDHTIYIKMLENMYKEHPVRDNILGTNETIANITIDDLLHSYQTFYHPQNMMLFIIGDLDEKQILTTIENNQSKKPFLPYKEIKRSYPKEDNKVNLKYEVIESDILIPKLSLGIKLNLNSDDKEVFALQQILIYILLEMHFSKTSEFYESLLDSELINDTFGYSMTFHESFQFIELSTDTHNPEQLNELLKTYLLDLKTKKINKEDFILSRNKLIAQDIYRLNYLEATANTFARFYFQGMNMFDVIELVQTVSIDMMKSVLDLIDSDAIATVIMYPKK